MKTKIIILFIIITLTISTSGCMENQVLTPAGDDTLSTSIPTNPQPGSLWLNTSTNEIGCYNGTNWNYYQPK